ncbi:hypothetical protein [Flavobacterium sp.]|uniref:hypothetical protein n=1 Tax=Flavobacterium sp. TaxID=239 RepID=UPI00286D7CCA|nr:hypothetical protein [Flavobacterium sp.]
MPNTETFDTFFNKFKESISNGTFAKLTLAKTIGNTQLMNIYVRTIVIDDELKFTLTFKYQTEEEIHNHTMDEAIPILTSYMNNPFLKALLFTTISDVTLKLNKKRVATIIEQAPTFKNADALYLEWYSTQ